MRIAAATLLITLAACDGSGDSHSGADGRPCSELEDGCPGDLICLQFGNVHRCLNPGTDDGAGCAPASWAPTEFMVSPLLSVAPETVYEGIVATHDAGELVLDLLDGTQARLIYDFGGPGPDAAPGAPVRLRYVTQTPWGAARAVLVEDPAGTPLLVANDGAWGNLLTGESVVSKGFLAEAVEVGCAPRANDLGNEGSIVPADLRVSFEGRSVTVGAGEQGTLEAHGGTYSVVPGRVHLLADCPDCPQVWEHLSVVLIREP